MVELTLLHLDVESVTAEAYAPFAKSMGDGEGAGETSGIEVERSGGGRVKAGLAAALVGLAFLVVAGLVLRRHFTEGEAEEETEGFESAEVTIE